MLELLYVRDVEEICDVDFEVNCFLSLLYLEDKRMLYLASDYLDTLFQPDYRVIPFLSYLESKTVA